MPDFQGLAGDPVDDIPGVRGVGAKTAAALLTEIGTLDGVYARIDETGEEALEGLGLRGARGLARRLIAERETAFLSRRLALLSRDALPPRGARETLAELEFAPPSRAAAAPVFDALGLSGSLARIPGLVD